MYDGSKLQISSDGKILNYDTVLSFIASSTTDMTGLNNLAKDIEDNIYSLSVHDLMLAKALLNNIKSRQSQIGVSHYQNDNYPTSYVGEEGMNFPDAESNSMDKGYAKQMRAPGTPRRRTQPVNHSIIGNINGSAVAVGIMMLNVVMVGIMYIIMAIAKING